MAENITKLFPRASNPTVPKRFSVDILDNAYGFEITRGGRNYRITILCQRPRWHGRSLRKFSFAIEYEYSLINE